MPNTSTSDIGLIFEARNKNTNSALSQGYIASFRSFITDYVRIAHNGNMLLQNGGTFTDGGQRLQVQGTTLLNGNVTFSSATGMTWDATNSRLGIGTNAPESKIEIATTTGKGISITANSGALNGAIQQGILNGNTITIDAASPTPRIAFGQSPTLLNSFFTIGAGSGINFYATTTRNFAIQSTISGTNDTRIQMFATTGNLLLQNGGTFTDSGERLQVTGTMKVTDTAVFSKKNTTTTSSSLVIGDDVGFAAGSNEPKLTIGSTNSRCGLLLGQSSNRGLLFNWTYNATPANAFGVLETYGGNNPLFIQTVGGNVGINTTTDVASALLHLTSTTKGFLPPRMTTTQKNAISSPAAGLVVYDTTLNKLCVYTTAWETITSI
jgi:hypothetical protein